MNNEARRLAVVTSATTPLGLKVISNLIREGYYVFGMVSLNKKQKGERNTLSSMPNVKLVPGCASDPLDWSVLA
ncbi:hypothetical protein, partial [Lysinibacillus xylanilyticus]|uniref:hypothetical protein n=1 Tax=Lysinibacillus xylanilyticus TaxID=582475 RepID=UPI0036D9DAA1